MLNLISVFDKDNCEVLFLEDDGDFTMDVEQNDEVVTFDLSEEDIINLIRNIANTSDELRKDIMMALIKDI